MIGLELDWAGLGSGKLHFVCIILKHHHECKCKRGRVESSSTSTLQLKAGLLFHIYNDAKLLTEQDDFCEHSCFISESVCALRNAWRECCLLLVTSHLSL